MADLILFLVAELSHYEQPQLCTLWNGQVEIYGTSRLGVLLALAIAFRRARQVGSCSMYFGDGRGATKSNFFRSWLRSASSFFTWKGCLCLSEPLREENPEKLDLNMSF